MSEDDETTSIELLSTQMLRQLLDTNDYPAAQLEKAAAENADGVLGINEDGGYEILEKNSLDALMNEAVEVKPHPSPARKATSDFGYHADKSTPSKDREATVRQIDLKIPDESEDLELVDTQMLRVMLDEKRIAEGKTPKYAVDETPSGNPYDSLGDALKKSKKAPEADGFNPYESGPGRKR